MAAYVKRTVVNVVTKTISKRICHLFSTTTVLHLNTTFTISFDWIWRTKHPVTFWITKSLISISNVCLVFQFPHKCIFPSCTHTYIKKTQEFSCKWFKLNNFHQMWGWKMYSRCSVADFRKCYSEMLPDSTRTTARGRQNPCGSSLWDIIINLGTWQKIKTVELHRLHIL